MRIAHIGLWMQNDTVTQSFYLIRIFYGRGIRGIFFSGGKGKVIFPGVKCFFQVENSHFGRPKTNFSVFKSEKQKKKKKKYSHLTFLSSISIFHLPFFWFSFFSPFSLCFLAPLFSVGQQKFPCEKCRGAENATVLWTNVYLVTSLHISLSYSFFPHWVISYKNMKIKPLPPPCEG